MLNPADLLRDDRLAPEAITAASHDGPAVTAALNEPSGTKADAALALAAGLARATAARDPLLALLDRDDLTGICAAWALAQMDSESAVVAAIQGGGIDVRTHGYLSLSYRIALGRASASLAEALVARVEAEIARVKEGKTGLGDLALRPLAMLGDSRCLTLLDQVQDADPYTDKFELQRLRKAVSDGGRDSTTISELKEPWLELFAEHLAPAQANASDAAETQEQDAVHDLGELEDDEAIDVDGEIGPADGSGDPAAAAPVPPTPIDWKAFAASPQGLALPDSVRALAVQLGPLLEQLAARAIGVGLVDLSGQEFAALLLQVLPQAMPPQHVQAALSPQALHGYQGIAKYLVAAGLAVPESDLLAGVKMVRQALIAQMRKSGMLGGADYSDPDDKPAKKA